MLKIWITTVLIFLAGSAAAAQTTGKRPVIIIPGVTGSQIVNPKTGKTLWFSTRRDKNDDLRLPMTSPILANNRDSLVAKDIIREVEILPILPDVEVYKVLTDALIAGGYTEATWDAPKSADVFYVFPYDWRRDNVETAQLLIKRMVGVKSALKLPKLQFDLVAHSMGGLIGRYAAMYGSADLPPAGRTPRVTWAGAPHINKLMMFGTPNEGAFGSLDALLNGYPIIADRKLPFVDDFRAEDLLTTPSAFQLIPHQSSARFLDENLQPLKVDLFNADTWLKYGWGAISDPKFLSKLKDADRLAVTNKKIKPVRAEKDAKHDDILIGNTTYAQVRAYFASVLSRADRFHKALDAPTTKSPVELYAFGGNCAQTLDAVVLIRDDKKGVWETLFDARDLKSASGKETKKDVVKTAMFAIGDGRVTKRSLLAETPIGPNKGPDIKTIFSVKSSFFGCGTHFKLFLEKEIQDSFLSALVVEKTNQP
jgi:pimeloyl-ACP methyl ester carboxylesterase